MAALGVSRRIPEAISDELTALSSIFADDRILISHSVDGRSFVSTEVAVDLAAVTKLPGVCPVIVDLTWALLQPSHQPVVDSASVSAPRTAQLLHRASSAGGDADGDAPMREPRLRVLLLQHLVPITVVLTLPCGYPDTAPLQAACSAPWLSQAVAAQLNAHAATLWAELGQGPAIFAYLEWLRSEAAAVLLRTDLPAVSTPTAGTTPMLSWSAAAGAPQGDTAGEVRDASVTAAASQHAQLPNALSLRNLPSSRVKLIAARLGAGAEEDLKRAEAVAQSILKASAAAHSATGPMAANAATAVRTDVEEDFPCLLIGGSSWYSSDPKYRETQVSSRLGETPAVTAGRSPAADEDTTIDVALPSPEYLPASLPTLIAILQTLIEHSKAEAELQWATADIVCDVCLDTAKGAEFHRIQDCRHVFCRRCLRTAVATGLAAEEAVDNAMQRVQRASACPDAACDGAMERAEIRKLLTSEDVAGSSCASLHAAVGKSSADRVKPAAGVGAATVHAAAASEATSKGLHAAYEKAVAQADAQEAKIIAARSAAAERGGSEPSTIRCPRHGCGSLAVLQEVTEDASQLLTCDWGARCIVFQGSPEAVLLKIARGSRVPRSGRAHTCAGGQRLTPQRRRMATCTGCALTFCADCRRSWHREASCTAHISSIAELKLQVMRLEATYGVPRMRSVQALLPPTPEALEDLLDLFGEEDGDSASSAARASKKRRRDLLRQLVSDAGDVGGEFTLSFDLRKASDLWSRALESPTPGAIAEVKSALLLAQNTRPCPGCGVLIQRQLGCNHMSCTVCRTAFCWACGKPRSIPGRPRVGSLSIPGSSRPTCCCSAGAEPTAVTEAEVMRFLPDDE